MDQRSVLDHEFVVIAYTLVWVIQLAYVAYLAVKWRTEKRRARLHSGNPR